MKNRDQAYKELWPKELEVLAQLAIRPLMTLQQIYGALRFTRRGEGSFLLSLEELIKAGLVVKQGACYRCTDQAEARAWLGKYRPEYLPSHLR